MKSITKDFLHGASKEQLEEVKWLIENPEWKQKPVDITTFVNDPYYLNLKYTVNGDRGYGCRPRILDRLVEIFDGKFEEFVLVCGIGWGKDFLCSIVLTYGLHIIGCLKDPANYYGLSKDSSIHLMLMSINEKHARDVLFGEVRARLDNCQWFKDHYKYDPKIQTEFHFPSKVLLIPGNSKDTTFVGYNIFMGIIDEGDDYQVTEVRNDAMEGYNSIKQRITSRFGSQGMLGMIGSPKTVDGFMMTMHNNDAGVDKRYTLLVPTWDSLIGTPRLSGEYFEYKGMQIPVEYRNAWKTNPETFMRDMGARPMLSRQPFITLVEKIDEMFLDGNGKEIENAFFFENDDKERSFQKFRDGILAGEDEIYYGHLDLAVNREKGDKLGFSVGHASDVVEIDGIEKPVITIDMAMSVKAPPGGEILFSDIKNMIRYLQQRGFSFEIITADSWNSVDMLQSIRKMDIASEIVSLDRTPDGYEKFKDALYESRIKCHAYPLLKKELQKLQIVEGKKIDHPAHGCFTGDTRVALLDGTNPTFEELFERYGNGEEFEVYSMSDQGICVGIAKNPRITKVVNELVEITLDNFQVIRCTPDHLFMTIYGDWVKAENITSDISIMPLYRSVGYKGGWNDYERVWCPIKKKRQLTHQMVYHNFNGNIEEKCHIHHIDGNKRNNTNKNLMMMSQADHVRKHTLDRHKNDKDYVQKLREGHKHYRENGGNEKSRENMIRLIDLGKIKKGREICSIEDCDIISHAKGLCDKHYQQMRRFQNKQNGTRAKNHRILSLRKIVCMENVWDITVEKYHNFALTSGVFVHNSKDTADAVAGVVYNIERLETGRILSFTPSFKGKRIF